MCFGLQTTPQLQMWTPHLSNIFWVLGTNSSLLVLKPEYRGDYEAVQNQFGLAKRAHLCQLFRSPVGPISLKNLLQSVARFPSMLSMERSSVCDSNIAESIWQKDFSYPRRCDIHVRKKCTMLLQYIWAQLINILKSYHGKNRCFPHCISGRCSSLTANLPLLNSAIQFVIVAYEGHWTCKIANMSAKISFPINT